MFEVAGFDSAVGVQAFRGDDGKDSGVTATEATIIDGQMQGNLGDKPLGIYVSYGTAPVVNNSMTTSNKFNTGGSVTSSSLNIAAEYGFAPGIATVMMAVRMGKDGSLTNGSDTTDNAVMMGLTYDIAMNVEASLSYTTQSGTKWDAPAGGVEPAGKAVTTLMLEALF
jgi:hypothetical protein